MTVPAAMHLEMTLDTLKRLPKEQKDWFREHCAKELRTTGEQRFDDANVRRESAWSVFNDDFISGYVFALYVVACMVPFAVDAKAMFGLPEANS